MRDQDIREMLYNAEEPVSPGVWSAVEAGLNARRKVVPAWLWSAVAVAAAAAVAAGVFLWRPSGLKLEEFSPSSQLTAHLDYSLPQNIVERVPEAPSATGRAVSAVALREEASLEAVQNATINPEVLLKVSSRLAMPPQSSCAPTVNDNSLLNELAWEARPLPGRDFSLTASGDITASSRAQAFSRRSAAAPASIMAEGVEYLSGDRPGVPFSAGIGLKWTIFPRWAVGTGVRYTNLRRSFIGNYHSGQGWSADEKSIDNTQHWLGVPVNVYFDIVDSRRFKVHAFAGGAVDYLLGNKFTIHSDKDILWNKSGTSFQWSASVGAGAEYLITRHIGIYLDPSVRYCFGQAGGQDINGLPAHPLQFMLEAGVRFSISSY
ncbi:MAG: PorT family protein [Bacteroidales bacterium]|nr:PorT family protein [Bacteroidales bacterium]